MSNSRPMTGPSAIPLTPAAADTSPLIIEAPAGVTPLRDWRAEHPPHPPAPVAATPDTTPAEDDATTLYAFLDVEPGDGIADHHNPPPPPAAPPDTMPPGWGIDAVDVLRALKRAQLIVPCEDPNAIAVVQNCGAGGLHVHIINVGSAARVLDLIAPATDPAAGLAHRIRTR